MTVSLDVEVTAGPVSAIPVPPTAVDQTLLLSDAVLYGWSFRESSGDIASDVEGSVTSPAAGATIVTTPALGAGTYLVKWSVELSGTLAAADSNNFELLNSAVVIAPSVNPGVAGVYPQPDVQLVVGPSGTVSIKAIAAGTVGAVYSAQLSVIPTPGIDAAAELQDVNSPIGEIAMLAGGSHSQWFGPLGVRVYGQIKLHVVQGSVTGAVYAAFRQ